ncbi:hypothetical protein OUZ56_018472 [Daphnia magna]|uniref:Uncharacterized protein n=1 Tax=Daphnia magna TaxID=35525 RepID=A0ABQ9ZA26_9CRUS|nr:hypothetical protein OUZ56_018472 [Daphnia magna]
MGRKLEYSELTTLAGAANNGESQNVNNLRPMRRKRNFFKEQIPLLIYNVELSSRSGNILQLKSKI